MEQHTQAAAYQTSQLLLELRWSTQLGWYTLQYSHPFRRTVQLVIFALQRTLAVELLHPVQALALVRALILSPATHKSHSHSHIGCIAGGGRGGGEYLLHTTSTSTATCNSSWQAGFTLPWARRRETH
jgi:hypothetical protein